MKLHYLTHFICKLLLAPYNRAKINDILTNYSIDGLKEKTVYSFEPIIKPNTVGLVGDVIGIVGM